MDIGDIKYLQEPVKITKLSDAIRAYGYENPAKWETCVLGCAITGITGMSADDWVMEYVSFGAYPSIAAHLFNVPRKICLKAEHMCILNKTPDEIADFIASEGY